MNITRKTLQENYIFFIGELVRINEEISNLPRGSISAKKIGNYIYYYHQWREGKIVHSIALGQTEPVRLINKISKRKLLEKQKKDILDNLNVIAKAVDVQKITAEEIIKIFAQNDIKAILIGSYCIPVLKENLGLRLPTIKTQDIDFLVNSPYRGKKIDVESLLKLLGFSLGFHADGSTYFTNGVFKVEFLVPDKGKGTADAYSIKPLHIKATPLRYLNMLFEESMDIKKEGYLFKVPAPWAFAYQKILILRYRKTEAKKEKDMAQINAILREVYNKPEMKRKAISYLDRLPSKWKQKIKAYLETNMLSF